MRTWFGVDDVFERPRPELGRLDAITVLVLWAFAAVQFELYRPLLYTEVTTPAWLDHLAIAVCAVLMGWRRRFPTLIAAAEFGLFYIAVNLFPEFALMIGFQSMCFLALYTCAAYARDRGIALVTLGAVLVGMFVWLAWDLGVGSGLDQLTQSITDDQLPNKGLLPPVVSSVLVDYLLNGIYVVGAVVLGRNAWQQARDRAQLVTQSHTIADQAEALRDRAVTEERLRIARELHDVVAHHVSVMGIQAGAARTMLDRDPALAAEALANVEQSSRDAVGEMRSLLGTLRGADERPEDRDASPSLARLDELVTSSRESGLQVDLTKVGDLEEVPAPLQLSLYRIVQEALNNVARHSSASSARVTVRRGPDWVEAEVLDDGRPIPGSSGSGLGHVGMRERVSSHGGTVEIGPRITGGYRVRARLPIPGGSR